MATPDKIISSKTRPQNMNFRDFGYTENDTLFDDNASLNPTVKRSTEKGRKPRFHVAVISVKYAIFFKGGVLMIEIKRDGFTFLALPPLPKV